MREIPRRLTEFLEERCADYRTIQHRLDYTSQEAAADTHTPGREFAKAVILRIDSSYAMAVLPAHHRVDLSELRMAVGCDDIGLASEQEISELIPDCEIGALPPFGHLYHLPVYLSPALCGSEHVTFQAGTHTEAIRMPYPQFEQLLRGRILDFSKPAETWPNVRIQ